MLSTKRVSTSYPESGVIAKACELPCATFVAPNGIIVPFAPALDVITKVTADGVNGDPVGTIPDA